MTLTDRELWAEARRLVVQEHMSYADAADATGLALSTLQKRAAREGWQDQRQNAAGYNTSVRRLKALALQAALTALENASSGDSPALLQAATQLMHAWRGAEAAYPEHRYAAAEEDPRAKLAMGLQSIEDLVAYLTEHDRSALTALRPHIAPFCAQLEARYAA